jgi:short-subunit dehydrogenase
MVKSVLIYGVGELSQALISELINHNIIIDIVMRKKNNRSEIWSSRVRKVFEVQNSYLEKEIDNNLYDIVIFTQSIFNPKSIVDEDIESIDDQFRVGLIEPLKITASYLRQINHEILIDKKIDICFIGSTSSYAGFKNTSIYCSIKHGLLGFVRSLNDEYSSTNIKSWLFSMGSMQTEMGKKVLGQDYNTFLKPIDVAKRIVSSLIINNNIFEPEQILRRRIIK